MPSVEEIIKKLNLKPHPEGGYYRETYRSEAIIKKDCLNKDYEGTRNCSTSIYFLLTSENFSSFHKIKQDEIWHFYLGSTIKLHVISDQGNYSFHLIGNDLLNSQVPQFVVKGGSWFAAEVKGKDNYALIGCTVSPGFSFEDFILGDRQELIEQFPEHKKVISRLTR